MWSFQLCTTPKCRQYIKEKNLYVILREYHKWEKDPACDVAVENLVHVLIGDEPEAGMENLKEVKLPEKIEASLDKAHDIVQKQVEEDTKKMQETSKS